MSFDVGRAAGSVLGVRTGEDAAGCDGSVERGADVTAGDTTTGEPADGCEVTVVCGVDENDDACGAGSGDGAAAAFTDGAFWGAGWALGEAASAVVGAPSIKATAPIETMALRPCMRLTLNLPLPPVRRVPNAPLIRDGLRVDTWRGRYASFLCASTDPAPPCHGPRQQTDEREPGQPDRNHLIGAAADRPADADRAAADHRRSGRLRSAAM